MDTGTRCATCDYLAADRRIMRRTIAAQVTRDLPAASAEKRHLTAERRIKQAVRDEAAETRIRHARGRAERDMRRSPDARPRAGNEVDRQQRPGASCGICRKPSAASLCTACKDRKAVDVKLREVALTAAVARADVGDPAAVGAFIDTFEADLRATVDDMCAKARSEGATEQTLVLLARLHLENTAREYRRAALSILNSSSRAEPSPASACGERTHPGHQHSMSRTSEQDVQHAQRRLETLLAELRRRHDSGSHSGSLTAGAVFRDEPLRRGWAGRLAMLAHRPLPEDKVS